MEIDQYACFQSDTSVDFSANGSVRSVGSGIQSLTLNNEAEMLENSTGDEELHTKNASWVNKFENTNTCDYGRRVFQQFQLEREDKAFSRDCLFCKKHFTGDRSLLLDHFMEQHNFMMGQPDNLVFINEFLDLLESMLKKLQCIYCEKFFKDWSALKEHMRKKMHKRINPNNKSFDKFYLSNYLHLMNNDEMMLNADEEEKEIEVEPRDDSIICLYCDFKYSDFDEIMNHLKDVHDFDFKCLTKEYKLSFYNQVKLINYIRQKVQALECTVCDTPFKSKEDLARHMKISRHMKLLPPRKNWDQANYFFSTLESDYLLCGLEDDNDYLDSNVEVISEDIVIPKISILADENLRRELS